MSYKEKDIKHEAGKYWVLDTGTSYSVMAAGLCVSTSDSSYSHDADGLSIAIRRCNYLLRRKREYIKDWAPIHYPNFLGGENTA